MRLFHCARISPMPVASFSTDDFGNEVQIVAERPTIFRDPLHEVEVHQDTWFFLFDMDRENSAEASL